MNFPWPDHIEFDSDEDFEKILTNPFLDIAARFWDGARYEAFRTCYRSMRLIDDLVDDRKVSTQPMSSTEVNSYRTLIERWLQTFEEAGPEDDFTAELLEVTERFKIPHWPWARLVKAMIYDLENHGFADFRTFLRYCEGAAIAPASVFVHLCGLSEDSDEEYTPPPYDIRAVARPLALFSYLVHILRDFQKDQLEGLNYFARDLMAASGVTRDDLRAAAEGGTVSDGVRDLISRYWRLAEYYRERARRVLDAHQGEIKHPYRLSLEVIYGLYGLVFDRVDAARGRFSANELNPGSDEIKQRLQEIVAQYDNPSN